MRITVKALLAWLALYNLSTGLWQYLAPRSFYDDFPGFGRTWISVDGPYNEHLLRDYGQGNLAFGVVALVALLTGGVWLARATGLAAVVANLPHHAYHQANMEVLPTAADQVVQTITLSAVSVTSILLAALAFGLPVRSPAAPAPDRDGKQAVTTERR